FPASLPIPWFPALEPLLRVPPPHPTESGDEKRYHPPAPPTCKYESHPHSRSKRDRCKGGGEVTLASDRHFILAWKRSVTI
ncbi:hypothetical protein IE53DRAFT_387573, partial [Violaceomyces palustris]